MFTVCFLHWVVERSPLILDVPVRATPQECPAVLAWLNNRPEHSLQRSIVDWHLASTSNQPHGHIQESAIFNSLKYIFKNLKCRTHVRSSVTA